MLDQEKGIAFEHLYHVSGIPFVIADLDGNVVQAYPPVLKEFYRSEYWSAFPGNLSDSNHPEGTTLICVGDMYHVAIIKLDKTLYLSTAPVSSVQNQTPSFFTALQRGIHPEQIVEFYRFLAELPAFSNTKLSEFASLAKLLYCGEPAQGTSLMYLTEGGVPLREVTLDTSIPAAPSYEETAMMKHMSNDFEESAKKAIAAGDEAMLNTAIRRPRYGSIGRMSLNDLRQARYEFICMMYASSRAAIQGRLTPEHSYQLSDLFCQRMDGMTRADEINLYAQECMRQFCRKVAENKHAAAYTPYTTACCEHIRQHLLETLNVDILSHAVGLNRRSLARYFIADTGMTILEYITEKRLEEGAYLLLNSDMSLNDISHLLQFSSQSQFTQKFRDMYKTTPAQYRRARAE